VLRNVADLTVEAGLIKAVLEATGDRKIVEKRRKIKENRVVHPGFTVFTPVSPPSPTHGAVFTGS